MADETPASPAAPAPAPPIQRGPDGSVYLLSPDNQVVPVPEERMSAFVGSGYLPATPHEVRTFTEARQLQQENAGPLGGVKAGIEAAGETALPGVFPAIERGVGIQPAAIEARAAAHPIIRAGAKLGTAVLLAGAGDPEAAAADVLPSASDAAVDGFAPGLISNLGKRAQTAISGALAPQTPLARIAAPILSGAGRTALEMGLYNAGDQLNDAILGDPQFTAEAALHSAKEIALSSLLGAPLGAVGGSLEGLGGFAKERLPDWIKAKGFETAATLRAATGNESAGEIFEGLRKSVGREDAEKILDEGWDHGLVGVGSSPRDTIARADALRQESASTMGQIVSEADLRLGGESAPKIKDLLAIAREEILKPLQKNELEQGAAARMETLLNSYGKNFRAAGDFGDGAEEAAPPPPVGPPNALGDVIAARAKAAAPKAAEEEAPGLTLSDLWQKRQEIDDHVRFDRQDPAFNRGLRELREIFEQELQEGVDRAGLNSADWQAAKRQFQVATVFRDLANTGLDKATQRGLNLNVGLGLGTGYLIHAFGGGLPGAIAAGGIAAAFRRFGPGIISAALRGIRGVGEGLPEAVEEAEAPLGEAGAGAAPASPVPAGGPAGGIPGGSGTEAPIRASTGKAKIVTPTQTDAAAYRLAEADDLLPSHDAMNFQPKPGYPEGVQERDYFSNQNKQKEVMLGGDNLDPARLLTDTPTAENGPPIVSAGKQPIVLAGNGRTLMVQRAYALDRAGTYRAELEAKAPSFGLDPADVRSMKKPVLVREVSALDENAPKSDYISAIRRYNQPLTQALSPVERGISDSRLISPDTVQRIGEIMEQSPESSLRDLLRDNPRPFVEALSRDGVIPSTERAQWVSNNALTEQARDRIEGMFLGKVMENGQRWGATAPALMRKVERIAAPLMKVEAINPASGEMKAVRDAVDLLNEAKRRGMNLTQLRGQSQLPGLNVARDPEAWQLAGILEKETPTQLAARFKTWAQQAAYDPRQATILMQNPTPMALKETLRANAAPAPAAASLPKTAVTAAPSDVFERNPSILNDVLRRKLADPSSTPERVIKNARRLRDAAQDVISGGKGDKARALKDLKIAADAEALARAELASRGESGSDSGEKLRLLHALSGSNKSMRDRLRDLADKIVAGKVPAMAAAEVIGADEIRRANKAKALAGNPSLGLHSVVSMTAPLSDHAPTVGAMAATALARQITALSMKAIPEERHTAAARGDLSRTHEMATDPLGALERGRMDQASLAQFEGMWPGLRKELGIQTLHALAANPTRTMTSRTQQQVARLIGSPVRSWQTPAFGAGVQAVLAAASMPAHHVAPSRVPLADQKGSQRTQTTTERVAEGLE